jgi:DNA-binding beta-propeller fold protein YncE
MYEGPFRSKALAALFLLLAAAMPAVAGRIYVPNVSASVIHVVDDATDSVERVLPTGRPYVACTTSTDGTILFAAGVTGGVDVLSASTGALIATCSSVDAIALKTTPANNTAFALSNSPAGVWALAFPDFRGDCSASFYPSPSTPASLVDLAVSPDGRSAFFSDFDDAVVRRVDFPIGTVTTVPASFLTGTPGGLAFSADGKTLFLSEIETSLVRICSPDLSACPGVRTLCGGSSRLALAPSTGQLLATCEATGEVARLDLGIPAPPALTSVGGIPRGLALSLDGRRVVVPDGSPTGSTVASISTATGAVVSTLAGFSRPSFPAEWHDPTFPPDPCSESWQAQPIARQRHAMAWDFLRNRLVLFGGASAGIPLADTWEWDGSAWTRRFPAHSPSPRMGHAMAWDGGSGRVLLFGGEDGLTSLGDTWAFDGTDWIRLAPASSPSARSGAGMELHAGIGKIVLYGGGSSAASAETWLFDGTDWQASTAVGPFGTAHAKMTWDSWRGKILLFGGGSASSFDGTSWSPAVPLPDGDFATDAPFVFDDGLGAALAIHLTGLGALEPSSRTVAFDGTDWLSPVEETLAQPRAGAATAAVPGLGALFFGGVRIYGNNIYPATDGEAALPVPVWEGPPYGDLWRIAGGEWAPLDPIALGGALAWDSRRGRIVSFGGAFLGPSGVRVSAETWEHDGARWIRRSPTTAPPAGGGSAMAFDERRGVSVLFGGRSWGTGLFGESWEWDGEIWTEKSWPLAPSPRFAHAMAFDPIRGKVVLFGGKETVGSSNETWLYDETGWQLAAPAHAPSPRYSSSLVWDESSGRLILFGGFDGNPLNDSWEWNGSDWTPVPSSVRPSARFSAPMVSATPPDRVRMIGGFDSSSTVQGEWILGPSGWRGESRFLHAPDFESGSAVLDDRRHRFLAAIQASGWFLGPRWYASAGASSTEACSGRDVRFSDESAGPVLSRLWTFGDGTTSTDPNPVHSFSSAGDYEVRLDVGFPCGSSRSTRRVHVRASPVPPLGNVLRLIDDGGSTIRLGWRDEGRPASYRVRMGTTPNDLPYRMPLVPSGNPGQDLTLPPNGTFYFEVTVVDACGESD